MANSNNLLSNMHPVCVTVWLLHNMPSPAFQRHDNLPIADSHEEACQVGIALRRHAVPAQSGRVPLRCIETRRYEDDIGLEVKS